MDVHGCESSHLCKISPLLILRFVHSKFKLDFEEFIRRIDLISSFEMNFLVLESKWKR